MKRESANRDTKYRSQGNRMRQPQSKLKAKQRMRTHGRKGGTRMRNRKDEDDRVPRISMDYNFAGEYEKYTY